MKRILYAILMLAFIPLGIMSLSRDLFLPLIAFTAIAIAFSLIIKRNVALTLIFAFAVAFIFFYISPREAKADQPVAVPTCAHQYSEIILPWCGLIESSAQAHNLDPFLIAAVITQESGGQPEVMSSAGAVGLMQVMPRDGISASFQCINGSCFANRPTIQELKDPAFNIDYGSGMLERLIAHNNGDVRESLFNYGPSGNGYIYADKVLSIYERIKN